MSKMAPWLGCDQTERLLVPTLEQLSSHAELAVRTVCASSYGDFCAVISTMKIETVLMPSFLRLCADPEYVIRKICAEVFISVSRKVTLNTRKTQLAPAFIRLLSDNDWYVQRAAFESLGPFIATFAEPSVTMLGYNQKGELVLKHHDGFEFRLDTSTVYPISWYVDTPIDETLFALVDGFSDQHYFPTSIGPQTHFPRMSQHASEDGSSSGADNFEFHPRSPPPWHKCFYNRHQQLQQQQQHQHQPQPQPQHQHQQQQQELQDDRNNNHDRLSDLRHIIEEVIKDSKEEVDKTNVGQTLEKRNTVEEVPAAHDDDTDIYNQFQYWRDPLPNIDTNLNTSNLNNNATFSSSSESSKVVSSSASELSSNNSTTSSPILANTNHITLLTNNSNNNHNHHHHHHHHHLNNNNNNNNGSLVNVKQPEQIASQQPQQQQQQPQRIMISLARRFQDRNVFIKESGSTSSQQSSIPASPTVVEKPKIGNKEGEKATPICPSSSGTAPTTAYMQDVVPLDLIKHFASMTELSLEESEFSELARHCAYNLPAVALTLGPKHWDLLKPVYETLAADRRWKVRRIVASSIHELAVIVGEEVATQDLVPVFNGFIKDLDEVRIAALKHLAHFLKVLRPAGRNSFLPRLTEFLMTDYEWNWRFRQELAEQLLQVLGLFSPADTCHHLSPVVLALLVDRVADVRKVALQLATELVSHVSIDLTLLRSLLAELAQKFAHSARWNRRQTFALFCSRLVSEGVLSGEMFARDVLPHLLDLSWDRVPNVRLTVARALANDVVVQPYFADVASPHFEVLHSVLKRLQGDKDRDVRYFASQVPLLYSPYHPNIEPQDNFTTVTEECSTTEDGNNSNLKNRRSSRQILTRLYPQYHS